MSLQAEKQHVMILGATAVERLGSREAEEMYLYISGYPQENI